MTAVMADGRWSRKATGGAPSRRPVFIAPAWRRSADWGTLRPLCGRARGIWASRSRWGSPSASPLPAWELDVENAVDESRRDLRHVDVRRQSERAVEPPVGSLDTMVVLVLLFLLEFPLAFEREGAVLDVEGELFLLEAGHLELEREDVLRLGDVHRRSPHGSRHLLSLHSHAEGVDVPEQLVDLALKRLRLLEGIVPAHQHPEPPLGYVLCANGTRPRGFVVRSAFTYGTEREKRQDASASGWPRTPTAPGASVTRMLANRSAVKDDRPEAFPVRLVLMVVDLLGRHVSDGLLLEGRKRCHRPRPQFPIRVGQIVRTAHGIHDVGGAARARRRQREQPFEPSRAQEKSRRRQAARDLADSGQRPPAARSRPERQRRRRTRSRRRRYHDPRVRPPGQLDGNASALPSGDTAGVPPGVAVRIFQAEEEAIERRNVNLERQLPSRRRQRQVDVLGPAASPFGP